MGSEKEKTEQDWSGVWMPCPVGALIVLKFSGVTNASCISEATLFQLVIWINGSRLPD